MRHANTLREVLMLPQQPTIKDYRQEINRLTDRIAQHRLQKQQIKTKNNCPSAIRRGENEWRRISFALHDRRSVLKSLIMASCNPN